MEDQKRAAHALNRLTFGPRPGDLERVTQLGVDKWIEQQLHPEKIDNSTLDARLASFRTLRMDTRHIVQNFPNNQIIKQVAEGKEPMPADPELHAIYAAQVDKYEDKRDRKAPAKDDKAGTNAAGEPGSDSGAMSMQADAAYEHRREESQAANIRMRELLDLPPAERFHEILKLPPEEQHVIASRAKYHKPELTEGMNSEQKETVLALNNPEQVVVDELTQAKLLRAVYSDRQLEEVMTDFWFNHFNIFINKGADRFLVTSYERDAIRPHVLGKFEDLLVATAQSPAMLFYLDNWLSVVPHSEVALGPPPQVHERPRSGRQVPKRRPPANAKAKPKQASGLNENYGRELMELHTLSVNGGYSQQDVTEVAKVFTGWTIDRPNNGGGFKFQRKHKDDGRDRVDLRSNAAAQPSPDFERQRVVAADQEKADGDFVHREREDQERRSDDGELEIRHRDAPESLPVVRAEIERGFFLRAVELLQSGENFGRGHGDERGAVAEDDGHEAQLDVDFAEEHQQRKSGDDAGKNQRQKNEAPEERFAGELRAIERERGGDSEGERDEHRGRGDDQTVEDRVPDGAILKKNAIPVEREVARRESADALAVEGINNEDSDRQVEKGEDSKRMDREPTRAFTAGCSRRHEKLHFFSSRSEKKSRPDDDEPACRTRSPRPAASCRPRRRG